MKFNTLHKKYSKLRRKLRGHPYFIPVVGFLVTFIVASVAFVTLSGQTIGASDSRVVQLYVDGQQQTIPTRAATVGELLRRLDVEIRSEDVIEPHLNTEILEDNFSINIYRAKPITIIDEGRKITTLSAQDHPDQVAEKAGVALYPEDKVDVEQADNLLRDGIIGQKIVIDRATPTNINLYGSPVQVRTHAKTVGEVLEEKDIKTLDGDTISPAPETPLTNDVQIFVVRVGKQIEAKQETIPAPVETIEDPSLPIGTTNVRAQGSPGNKVVTYEIELRNNVEASRRVLQEVVVTPPVKKVVVKGVKVIYSNPSANVELGRQIADEMGYGGQFSCIYSIFQRESKWNHLARNRSSGAYGIPQALPGSKMGIGWENDPAVQIRWGINYMVKRYGSPCGAQQFWEVNHWY